MGIAYLQLHQLSQLAPSENRKPMEANIKECIADWQVKFPNELKLDLFEAEQRNATRREQIKPKPPSLLASSSSSSSSSSNAKGRAASSSTKGNNKGKSKKDTKKETKKRKRKDEEDDDDGDADMMPTALPTA